MPLINVWRRLLKSRAGTPLRNVNQDGEAKSRGGGGWGNPESKSSFPDALCLKTSTLPLSLLLRRLDTAALLTLHADSVTETQNFLQEQHYLQAKWVHWTSRELRSTLVDSPSPTANRTWQHLILCWILVLFLPRLPMPSYLKNAISFVIQILHD